MDAAEKETARLWRIHKTVHHMVHDRGYIVSQMELDMALGQFVEEFGNGGVVVDRSNLTFLVQKKDDPTDQIFVFFPDDYSVGVKTIRTYCERMVEQNIYKAIIVVRQNMTPSANKVITTMAPKYILEHFNENELLVNITEHQLVPKHQLLTATEKATLLKRYRLKDTQLPRIQITDPVARYYGLRKGQVVKIVRASETAGRYVTYRLVS